MNPDDNCLMKLCFEPINYDGPLLITTSDYLAALALLLIAWTLSDETYKLRLKLQRFKLTTISFVFAIVLGLLILATEYWIAKGLWVIRGNLISPATWQFLLAFALLGLIGSWILFSFILPPVFGKYNAKKFADELFTRAYSGHEIELIKYIKELERSIDRVFECLVVLNHQSSQLSDYSKYGHEIVYLLGERRVCRAIVMHYPEFLFSFLSNLEKYQKHTFEVSIFLNHIVSEALLFKDSFLHREQKEYTHEYIGRIKPISNALFGDVKIHRAFKGVLVLDYDDYEKWDSVTWSVYSSVVLQSANALFSKNNQEYIQNQNNVVSNFELLIGRITYGLDHNSFDYSMERFRCIRVITELVTNYCSVLDGAENYKRFSVNAESLSRHEDVLSHLVDLAYTLILRMVLKKQDDEDVWQLYHNELWSPLFSDLSSRDSSTLLALQQRLLRKFYHEISRLPEFPNYEGSAIIRYLLTIFGLSTHKWYATSLQRRFHKLLLEFVATNYATIESKNKKVAESCLPPEMTLDKKRNIIEAIYPPHGLREHPTEVRLKLK